MGTLLAAGGSGVLLVLEVWAGAALLLVAEALGIAALLLVAGGGGGWYALAHGISTLSKTLAERCKAYNSLSNAVTRSSHDKVLVVRALKCITL